MWEKDNKCAGVIRALQSYFLWKEGEFSMYQVHGNIFESIFTLGSLRKHYAGYTLGLFASFCLPVINSVLLILKTNHSRFDSKEQGRQRNGLNLNSERIKYSAYKVHWPYYSSFTSIFLCIASCPLFVLLNASWQFKFKIVSIQISC